MKILLTGGAGYVGTSLIPMLLELGYEVRVLDNLMYTGVGLLPFFKEPSFEFVKGDIRDFPTVDKASEGCRVIIHLAAIVGFPACIRNPKLAHEVNFIGTNNVLQAAKDRLILFGSTGSNYGVITDQVCTEETPLNPVSHYAKTKAAAEKHLLEWGNVIAYRFATGFGVSPRMRLDLLVNDFVYQALKNKYLVVYEKNFNRSFIHVRDMARAFIFALQNHERMVGQIYNVGTDGMNYTKAQICEKIKLKTNCHVHYAEVGEDWDKRNYWVSYAKIKNLGYEPLINLDSGIHELIQAMQVLDVKNAYSND